MIGLWNTSELTVRLHAPGCPMLVTANKRRGIIRIDTSESLEDMRQRGYRLIECRCLKRKSGKVLTRSS